MFKQGKPPDKSSLADVLVDLGSAMEGLVCEIDTASNMSQLSEDEQGDVEAMVVASPKGVKSTTSLMARI